MRSYHAPNFALAAAAELTTIKFYINRRIYPAVTGPEAVNIRSTVFLPAT
jgi:hypothetical protein